MDTGYVCGFCSRKLREALTNNYYLCVAEAMETERGTWPRKQHDWGKL